MYTGIQKPYKCGSRMDGLAPRVYEHIHAPAGIGRARRGQEVERDIRMAQEFFIIALEGLGGFAAIAANCLDAWIFLQQGREIIAAFIFDGGVETACALTAIDGVPECNMMAQQHLQTFCVIFWYGRLSEQACHQRPETVLRMGIVLLLLKGSHAGHRA